MHKPNGRNAWRSFYRSGGSVMARRRITRDQTSQGVVQSAHGILTGTDHTTHLNLQESGSQCLHARLLTPAC
jgi:hypothetical protein